MNEPFYFYWTTHQVTLFAATHDEGGKGLPAHLGHWALLTSLCIDRAGKLANFPEADANAEIKKAGVFLFHAGLSFVDIKPVPK
jgi:hypothetical protein